MAKALSSPLVSAANNIVSMGSASKRALPKFQREYSSFIGFLEIKKVELDRIKLPEKKKIREIANLNVASVFGTPGNLLGGLASGALDVAGFLGNMFPGRGKMGKPGTAQTKPPKPISKGNKVRFGGIRSIGVVNALFAGLDFATGLQEGESVGKSAAGAGGSLAGSLLGGAIGQALIPVPGLGFVLGSMAGSFLGGYAGDRAYEAATGTGGGNDLKKKTEAKIKAQEAAQKAAVSGKSFGEVLDKFESVVIRFESFSRGFGSDSSIGPGTYSDINAVEESQTAGPGTTPDGVVSGDYPGLDNVERVAPFTTGSVSDYPGAQFGASRPGGRVHAGQDIKDQKAGDPVLAAMAGTVVEVGTGARWQKGGGTSQTIGIRHKDGTMTRYVHVMAKVGKGQEVKTGQQIGTISPADVWSSPDFPHLHFEFWSSGGKALDPRPFLKTAPRTPAVAPIKPGSKISGKGPDAQTMKFGANDINSAPKITIGDSIAEGVKNQTGSSGSAQSGANPQQVLQMLQSQDVKGKLVRLSSGISNDTSQMDVVRQQLKYAQQQGAKGVQLMGTSVDRGDLAGLNPKLKALAEEFSGFVQFAGGFNAADKIHPDYKKYSQKLNSLIAPTTGGMGGLGVDISKIERPTQAISEYTSYSDMGSETITILPITTSTSQTIPQAKQGVITIPIKSGGDSLPVMDVSEGDIVNSLMKTILLTSLSAS